MHDNIDISDQIKLAPTQWTALWNALFIALQETHQEHATPLTADTADIPTEVGEALGDWQGVSINPRPDAPRGEQSVVIEIEGASRDLDEVYADGLAIAGYKLLAVDTNYQSDSGEGESERLFSAKDHSVAVSASLPSYCDDESDAYVTLTIMFGAAKERQAYHARKIKQINNDIINRIQAVLTRAPLGQLRAMRGSLAHFNRKIERKLAA